MVMKGEKRCFSITDMSPGRSLFKSACRSQVLKIIPLRLAENKNPYKTYTYWECYTEDHLYKYLFPNRIKGKWSMNHENVPFGPAKKYSLSFPGR